MQDGKECADTSWCCSLFSRGVLPSSINSVMARLFDVRFVPTSIGVLANGQVASKRKQKKRYNLSVWSFLKFLSLDSAECCCVREKQDESSTRSSNCSRCECTSGDRLYFSAPLFGPSLAQPHPRHDVSRTQHNLHLQLVAPEESKVTCTQAAHGATSCTIGTLKTWDAHAASFES